MGGNVTNVRFEQKQLPHLLLRRRRGTRLFSHQEAPGSRTREPIEYLAGAQGIIASAEGTDLRMSRRQRRAMYQTLEQPQGRGKLVGEGIDVEVSYALRVMQEESGLKRIDGTVEFNDAKQEYQCFGKTMTLHLEDGRRLRVIVQGSGQIQGTGGFLKP